MKTRRERREELGMSIEAMARACRASASMIRFCETGRREPSAELAKRWDSALAREEARDKKVKGGK